MSHLSTRNWNPRELFHYRGVALAFPIGQRLDTPEYLVPIYEALYTEHGEVLETEGGKILEHKR